MEPPMKMRHLAAWSCAMTLLGTGATLLLAQTPPGPRPGAARPDPVRLRAEIIKLRTEVEMLRFDYELARDVLLEDLKTRRSFQMAGAMMQLGGAIQSAINEASANPGNPPTAPKVEPKKEAEEAKKAEQEEKKEEAEQTAFIAERKKKLASLHAAWAGKLMDLEDAERAYRDPSR
jgi:hypothetical protein